MEREPSELESLEFRFVRSAVPYRVFATWNIHYACNYQCSYCHAPKPDHKDARKAVYLSSSDWINIWRKIYARYGTWELLISGGEPFAYPDFMELIINLSRIHLVGVCTNLSWDVAYFVKHVGPDRVRIETSFHPEFSELNQFIEKLHILKAQGFEPTVNFVPWPPLLGQMQKIKETIEGTGCQLTLQPFIGQYENRSYPQGYTDKERKFFDIFTDDCNLKTLDFKTTKESDTTKGKLCRMGQNYVFIHPDGSASRCCRDHTLSLGNLIDGSFNLLENPVACNADNCNCWRCMLVGKEDFWAEHWGRRQITDKAMQQGKKNDNFKIVLAQAPVWGVFEPPVALAQISSCLKKEGYDVSVFDLNIELYNRRTETYQTAWAIEQSGFWGNKDNVQKYFNDNRDLIEEYVQKIISQDPALIGFSVNVCSLSATLLLARMIKQKRPEIIIALGGAQFFLPIDVPAMFTNEYFDLVVWAEGEETFCELAGFLKQGNDLAGCKGIYYRKNGEVFKTEDRPAIKNLDALPFLDLESLPLDKYDPPGHLKNHISLMASRGCVQNCVFCGPKAYWRGYRAMSGKRVYDEIGYHIQHYPQTEHIEFLDLLYNGNMRYLIEFCDLMIANPLKENLHWHANAIIRPEMTLQVLSKMKKAGCSHLTYGIESGSQHVLNLMRKHYKIEDADEVLKNTHEAGIEVTCNFMFGFPGETGEDFQQTLAFLKRNAGYITTAYPSRTYCTIEPHSYLEKHFDEFGIVPNSNNNLYWESKDGSNNFPERLKRCEEFSSFADSLGVSVGLGLQTSIDLDRWYNLGHYYESRGDAERALSYFTKYLKCDPKNEVITEKVNSLRQFYPPIDKKPVSFNWDIHWVCNYRCPYCWFYGKWADISRYNTHKSAEELIEAWRNIYKKYGKVKVSITGGEPFLYPHFTEFITELSKMHKVEIISNLSADIKNFVGVVNAENVTVNPSFHPLFADFDKFVGRVELLKESNLVQCVSCVAWPPHISRLGYFIEAFKKRGITISIQSFFGEHNGKRYPDSYSEEEKRIILPQIGQRGGKSFQTEAVTTKGRLCAAGHRYGVIQADGTVFRCGGMNSSNGTPKVGNLFDKDFSLLNGPSACTFEVCPCNEWAFLNEMEQK